jgi:hypothetical protein
MYWERRFTMPLEVTKENWHLDKRVSVATIIALLLAVAAGVGWLSDTRSGLSLLRKDVFFNTQNINDLRKSQNQLYDTVILRMEQMDASQQGRMDRLEKKIDKLTEREIDC